MEPRVPSALDDFLFDLNGYVVLKNEPRPDQLARLNAAFDNFSPLDMASGGQCPTSRLQRRYRF